MAKAALLMGVKCVLLANNAAHMKFLQTALSQFIKTNMENDLPHFTPVDKAERIADAKTDRFLQWEQQQATQGQKPPETTPSEASPNKRPRLTPSNNWEASLMVLGGGAPMEVERPVWSPGTPAGSKEPVTPLAKTAMVEAAAPSASTHSRADQWPQAGTNPPAAARVAPAAPAPAPDLAAMLQQWS